MTDVDIRPEEAQMATAILILRALDGESTTAADVADAIERDPQLSKRLVHDRQRCRPETLHKCQQTAGSWPIGDREDRRWQPHKSGLDSDSGGHKRGIT